MSEPIETVEQEIQRKGLSAPRVTPQQIEGVIASAHYFTALQGSRLAALDAIADGECLPGWIAPLAPELGLLTICVLVLRNGFTVLGKSACASPESFDAELGRKIARADAVNQIWALEGYLLKQRLYLDRQMRLAGGIGDAELVRLAKQDDLERILRIAKTAHEINRAYCASLGDLSQPAWEDAPDWQRSSAIDGVKFHLANLLAGPDQSHNNWLAEKQAAGWKYGPVKDPERKEHPCFVPYDQLPKEQQAKDYLFRATVHQLAAQ